MRDDWRFLKYAFKARIATNDEQEQIANERGIRWSALDSLPGWLPGWDSPTDFMHAIFLGESTVRHTSQILLTLPVDVHHVRLVME